jgi:hypothetical protein
MALSVVSSAQNPSTVPPLLPPPQAAVAANTIINSTIETFFKPMASVSR